MVGFDPRLDEVLSRYEHACAGALSGVFTRAICQPLDVLKIRFQLQVEPVRRKNAGKYRGMLQAAWVIVSEEKPTALWKGHIPAQYLSVAYGVSQFVCFEILTARAWRYLPEEFTRDRRPLLHFACGAVAGGCATVASFPFDVIRTRLVAQGEPRLYAGMADAAAKMFKQQGPAVFFRGLWPTMIQVMPYTGLQFGFYTAFTQMWKATFAIIDVDTGWVESLVCGSVSGVAAKSIVYPFDLAKKRMQVQGFDDARRKFGQVFRCTGMTDCLAKTVRYEGLGGLYKGFLPSLVKAAVASALTFCFYEQLIRGFRIFRSTPERDKPSSS